MLIALLLALADPTPPPRLAVIDLAPASKADAALATLLSDAVAQSVASHAKDARVVGQAELRGMLDAAALQQLLGCVDERCAADFTGALAVDQLVVGRAGRVGDQVLVFLSLVDAKAHTVLARASHAFPANADLRRAAADATAGLALGPKLVDAVAPAAKALFLPEAALAGDKPLAELRMAVVLDELDETGARQRVQPVETCVQKQLLAGGAALVSPAVVATLKGKAKPREILDGRVPDELGTDEVDVLFAGVVDYSAYAEAGAAKLGFTSARAQMGAQLVRVDTGDILASEQPSALGKGHSLDAAKQDAAKRLCDAVKPLLENALRQRVDQGQRVVLEVAGVDAPAASALVAELEKLRRVGKARLKKSAAGKATVDVALASGDGIALALDLAKLPGLVVDSATAGLVRVQR